MAVNRQVRAAETFHMPWYSVGLKLPRFAGVC